MTLQPCAIIRVISSEKLDGQTLFNRVPKIRVVLCVENRSNFSWTAPSFYVTADDMKSTSGSIGVDNPAVPGPITPGQSFTWSLVCRPASASSLLAIDVLDPSNQLNSGFMRATVYVDCSKISDASGSAQGSVDRLRESPSKSSMSCTWTCAVSKDMSFSPYSFSSDSPPDQRLPAVPHNIPPLDVQAWTGLSTGGNPMLSFTRLSSCVERPKDLVFGGVSSSVQSTDGFNNPSPFGQCNPNSYIYDPRGPAFAMPSTGYTGLCSKTYQVLITQLHDPTGSLNNGTVVNGKFQVRCSQDEDGSPGWSPFSQEITIATNPSLWYAIFDAGVPGLVVPPGLPQLYMAFPVSATYLPGQVFETTVGGTWHVPRPGFRSNLMDIDISAKDAIGENVSVNYVLCANGRVIRRGVCNGGLLSVGHTLADVDNDILSSVSAAPTFNPITSAGSPYSLFPGATQPAGFSVVTNAKTSTPILRTRAASQASAGFQLYLSPTNLSVATVSVVMRGMDVVDDVNLQQFLGQPTVQPWNPAAGIPVVHPIQVVS